MNERGAAVRELPARPYEQNPTMPWRIAIALVSAISLLGCASSQKIDTRTLLPEIDVVQVKENSDEALRIAQEAKLAVDALNSRLTEMDNRMVLLSEEVSAVSIAKIEELENRLSLVIEALKDQQAQLSAIDAAGGRRRGASASPPPTFSPAEAAGALIDSPESAAYQKALSAYRDRNYPEAQRLFTEVLNQFPKGTYADNCHYWIGECSFALGDHAKAIASFKEVFTFSRSQKADDAQIKIGLCYMKMGQNALAKSEFQKLLDRYPGSEYTKRAQDYLSGMK